MTSSESKDRLRRHERATGLGSNGDEVDAEGADVGQ